MMYADNIAFQVSLWKPYHSVYRVLRMCIFLVVEFAEKSSRNPNNDLVSIDTTLGVGNTYGDQAVDVSLMMLQKIIFWSRSFKYLHKSPWMYFKSILCF